MRGTKPSRFIARSGFARLTRVLSALALTSGTVGYGLRMPAGGGSRPQSPVVPSDEEGDGEGDDERDPQLAAYFAEQ